MKQQHLVVIGGGAAGFFCAVNAARLNPLLKVTIVEKSNKVLSKVRVSGGGRCNVTHSCFEINELVKKYPRGQNFLKKAFHWFNTKDTIQWFEERGVQLKTEADGRMFPVTNSSETIAQCLLQEANKYNVEVKLGAEVTLIEKQDDLFKLTFANTKTIEANFLCVASGGYPKALQFQWVQKMGHSIQPPLPSLFTFNIPDSGITSLMGVAVEKAIVKIKGSKLSNEGPLLITHWGLSGPAVLKLSSYGARELGEKNYHFDILVNWMPEYSEQSLQQEWQYLRAQYSSNKVYNKNPFGIPNRLWSFFLQTCSITEEKRWGDINSKQQNQLIKCLTAFELTVKGKTTFKEEFVTCGGIKLTEIDANTMQSKIVPHLFFAGEVMDVDGITGGFNFQNAWTSGFIAAKTIAQYSN